MAIFKTKKSIYSECNLSNEGIEKELGLSENLVALCEESKKTGCIESDKIYLKDFSGNMHEISITEDQASNLNKQLQDSSEYKRWIRNLNLGEYGDKIKPILLQILSKTQKVGNVILRIGEVLIEIIIKIINTIVNNFPNTILGAIVGFIIGILLSSFPLIGGLLSGFIIPLCTSVGAFFGFVKDMKNKIQPPELAEKIENAINNALNIFSSTLSLIPVSKSLLSILSFI